MHRGTLSSLYIGAVAKRLTLVETITSSSNQHEFQGVQQLRHLLGHADRRRIPARFIWLSDEQGSVSEEGFLSWSDVRKGKPRSAEYHLYYSTNAVTELMAVGDLLIIALHRNGSILAVIVPANRTSENQLLWLFGLEPPGDSRFSIQHLDASHDTELGSVARYILDELGIEPEEPEASRLDSLIEPFGLKFPTTKVFSALARGSLPEISARDDPDDALIDWLDREEQLFRRLERRIVAERVGCGFKSKEGVDVDGFLAFSLSVQNRRKARAGQALENHLEAVFGAHQIRYARGAETENRNKPDFLFPGSIEYHDDSFPKNRLSILGAKSTLKDRWRQVLSEAEKIEQKHLLTLEPAISENQTEEMRAKSLQLVVPRKLHETFTVTQKQWLFDLSGFIALVRSREEAIAD